LLRLIPLFSKLLIISPNKCHFKIVLQNLLLNLLRISPVRCARKQAGIDTFACSVLLWQSLHQVQSYIRCHRLQSSEQIQGTKEAFSSCFGWSRHSSGERSQN
jgi:hypothetical protein